MRAGVIRRLLALLGGQRGRVAFSASCRVANLSLGVAIPAVAVGLLPTVADGRVGLGAAMAILVGLALMKGTLRYLEQYTGHAVAFRLLADLRNRVFRWLERLEPGRLHDERAGDLVARVSGDIDRVEPFYAHTIAPAIAAVVVPTLALVGLGVLAGAAPVLALTPFLIGYLAIVPWIGSRQVSVVGPRARRLAGETAAAVADFVQGAREIAVLGAGDRVVGEISHSEQERGALEARLAGVAALRSLMGGLISAGAILSVAIAGVASALEFQALAVSVVIAWSVWSPVRALDQIVPDTEQSLAAAARLFDLEDRKAQSWGQAPPPKNSQVRFEALTVRSGSKTVLDAVDLAIRPGAFVAVVGPSGSGKTTLVQSLLRYRDPLTGTVSLGATPLEDLASSTLSELVTIVPQRPDVFHGTIASNLLIASPGAGREDLRQALDRAGLLAWVDEQEGGLDSPVGERGVGMSGGQVQRLALARAFLRDPVVLILDEATSELDPVTERDVLDQVHTERGRRTLIVVAHRMETVVGADAIVVMDRGRVVEIGAHHELRRAGGLYAALWERHEDILADS